MCSKKKTLKNELNAVESQKENLNIHILNLVEDNYDATATWHYELLNLLD